MLIINDVSSLVEEIVNIYYCRLLFRNGKITNEYIQQCDLGYPKYLKGSRLSSCICNRVSIYHPYDDNFINKVIERANELEKEIPEKKRYITKYMNCHNVVFVKAKKIQKDTISHHSLEQLTANQDINLWTGSIIYDPNYIISDPNEIKNDIFKNIPINIFISETDIISRLNNVLSTKINLVLEDLFYHDYNNITLLCNDYWKNHPYATSTIFNKKIQCELKQLELKNIKCERCLEYITNKAYNCDDCYLCLLCILSCKLNKRVKYCVNVGNVFSDIKLVPANDYIVGNANVDFILINDTYLGITHMKYLLLLDKNKTLKAGKKIFYAKMV